VKHSGASRVDILVRFSPDATELVVADDGCGVDHESGESDAGHFGLQGMRERANKIGAVLELESEPRGGTRLAVSAPVDVPGARMPELAHEPGTAALSETNHG
jgi:two-component system, NarL family, nitrate/nitrite sensor histidine kinase NarX